MEAEVIVAEMQVVGWLSASCPLQLLHLLLQLVGCVLLGSRPVLVLNQEVLHVVRN